MRLLVTGGGTGGHIYPALAIAEGFLEQHPAAEVLYVGTAKGLEADIVPKAGLNFKTVTVMGLPRRLSLDMLTFGTKLIKGVREAAALIKQFQPDLVVGTGGYVCGPVVWLAARAGIPTLIHEQNALPGITNKLLARYVKTVAITFQEARSYFPARTNVVHTGLPIRGEILTVDPSEAWTRLKLQPGKPLLLITGGSRGARSLNRAMVEVYRQIAAQNQFQVLHMTGQQLYTETLDMLSSEGINWMEKGNISITPYLYNMADALAVADLIICRAGAATLAEITAKGIPAVLVPYPFAAENHQEHNARALEKGGAAVVIKDSELTGSRLKEAILGLLGDRQRLQAMGEASLSLGRPQALKQIVACMDQLVSRGK